MCRDQNPSTVYCLRKMNTMTQAELEQQLKQAPVSQEEMQFILDIRNRMTLKQLATKYNLTIDGVAKRKQRIYTRLHQYDINHIRH